MNREMIDTIYSANLNYDAALRRQSGVNVSKERLKNVLFNCRSDLVKLVVGNAGKHDDEQVNALKAQINKLKRDLESMNQSMAEADDEYNSLLKKYKQLESKSARGKRKAVDMDAEE